LPGEGRAQRHCGVAEGLAQPPKNIILVLRYCPTPTRSDPMSTITGLHHVTVISGDAQQNLDFYAGVLGMRLVKRSVNQDDPGTYHLFYADAEGHPGSDLTFFPWAHAAPPRAGHGMAMEAGLEIPAGTRARWAAR